jgi:hypothetical protein
MSDNYVHSRPLLWLRLDGAVLFIASITLFALTHQKWWVYPALLFVPDIFMIGYVRSSAVGAFFYNAGHSYFLPSLTLLLGWHHPLVLAIGLIWLGHVGFDRMMGYGLKYDSGFKHTHLGSLENGKSTQK